MLGFRCGGEKMISSVGLKGWITIIVRDKDGNIKQKIDIHNVITNSGKAYTAGLLGGINTAPFEYIAIGTGTTAASASDTALQNEIARKQATVSQTTTSVTNDTLQLQATFSSSDGLSGTSNVSESGVFNASSGGTMLCRQTFSAISVNWDAGDTLQITWKIQVQ